MSGKKECFLVTMLEEDAEFTDGDTADFVWAKGMIGVVPVFDTKKHAIAYADNDESLITRLERV